MAKTSVYMKDSLRADVDKYLPDLNVSEALEECLYSKIESAARAKATEDIDALAARLRASLQDEMANERRRGRDSGKTWATMIASLSQLRRCVSARNKEYLFRDDGKSWNRLIYWICEGGNLEKFESELDYLDYMEIIEGSMESLGLDSGDNFGPEGCRSFCDGCAEVLRSVEGKL